MGSTANQQQPAALTGPWTLEDRLTKARENAVDGSMTQEQLGVRLGLTRATIGRYEKGLMPEDEKKRTIPAWAVATGWSYRWLRDGVGPWLADGTDGPGGTSTPTDLRKQGFG